MRRVRNDLLARRESQLTNCGLRGSGRAGGVDDVARQVWHPGAEDHGFLLTVRRVGRPTGTIAVSPFFSVSASVATMLASPDTQVNT